VHISHIGEMRKTYKILEGKPEWKDHSEVLDIDGRITLEGILGKQDRKLWTGFIWLRTETRGGLL